MIGTLGEINAVTLGFKVTQVWADDPPSPSDSAFPLWVVNYALAGSHKFKPQQGHKSRNGIVFAPKTLCVCDNPLDAEMVCVGGISLFG